MEVLQFNFLRAMGQSAVTHMVAGKYSHESNLWGSQQPSL